jgi:hypothetical protein
MDTRHSFFFFLLSPQEERGEGNDWEKPTQQEQLANTHPFFSFFAEEVDVEEDATGGRRRGKNSTQHPHSPGISSHATSLNKRGP